VDQARDQGFLFSGAAFALEETTRDAAAGVELFLVVDGEGEEVLPLALRLGRDRGDQQHGAVALDHDRAAGLARDLAGLQRDFMVAVLEGLGDFRHVGIPWMSSKTEPRRIAAPRSRYRSAAQAQFLDQRLVPLGILAVQVVE